MKNGIMSRATQWWNDVNVGYSCLCDEVCTNGDIVKVSLGIVAAMLLLGLGGIMEVGL